MNYSISNRNVHVSKLSNHGNDQLDTLRPLSRIEDEQSRGESRLEHIPSKVSLKAAMAKIHTDDSGDLPLVQEDQDVAPPTMEQQPVVKFDAVSSAPSAVTYVTEVSGFSKNPTTVGPSVASSKIELQLNFLARELELERQRREKLQEEVDQM